ncbi:UDP-glucose 4-epimerase GalE [Acuticoccus sp. I52.16.1]|uniref:UDP-glucose 4-epimerase GalE n=1 Tax=Acuticoccus sp. I52.16.1 TaxID=2928472 RepID=UPI001FD4A340|nr:UDP-glucose 4-epimerase GalE [Acuticoccus sp. I52.16.1]UOM36242.1 UDP-glucose 4-epimerase GalE [Acuticoccus sp. I52.16.1]
MNRVLVTGGAGYIGSHCCKALAAAGFEPVVYDNLSTGHRHFCKWGPLVPGDIRDADTLARTFEAMRPVAVMHFAAQSIVPRSTADPQETFDVNVAGTLNLLEVMKRFAVERLVFSSTCAIYGNAGRGPIDEAHSNNPITPYGTSKAMVESILASYEAAYGLRSVRLRYFNAAGADEDAAVGEWHEPETHLIPIVLDVALGLRPALQINGSDYDTEDGTAVRDYIHVEDLASAHVAALTHLLDGGEGISVNVGTGAGHSVAEIVRAVSRLTGRAVPTIHGPRRLGDPPRLVANPRRALQLLSWRPTRDIEAMIRDAWRWHQDLRRTDGVTSLTA